MERFAGYPAEVADYLKAGPRRALRVRAVKPYTIEAAFDDGAVKEYDMSARLYGMLEDLKDYRLFEKVYLDDTNSIAWDTPKGHIDTSKDTIYIYGTTIG